MVQLLGWLRPPLPPRPGQEARGKGSKRRHQVAAPTAGSSAGGGACQPPVEQPPKGDSSSAGGEGTSAAHGQESSKTVVTLPGAVGVAAILASARNWGFLLKALAAHSANLAANLAARPLAPLHDRLQRQLAATSAVGDACEALGVEGLAELQDLLNCVLLSEHVYKIVDHSTEASVGFINAVKAEFPPQLVTLQAVSWAAPHVKHRYLLGESPDALYVSFMGTKLPRDMATNANLFQEEVVLDAAMLSSGAASADDLAGGAINGGTAAAARPGPAAHRGFLARARSVPILALYAEARARGKRLILTGHSLGGAVASLCAVRLLQRLPPALHHTVACYGFATPALGNEALAATVKEAGWEGRIRNYLSPDDPIPKLLSFRNPPAAAATEGGEGAAAAAPAAAAPALVAAQAAEADAAATQRRLQPAGGRLARGGAPPATGAAVATAAATAAAPATAPGVSNIVRSSGLSRAGGSPRAVAALAVAADEAAAEPGAAQAARGSGSGGGRARLTRAGVAAATSAAVAAAVLGQHVDVAAATSAAVAAAMLRQDGSLPPQQSGGDAARPGRQDWLRAASTARPVRAVVERAGSAARFVAAPLSAAAPQYVPLGRQLYITPAAVSAAKPPGERWDEPTCGAAAPTAAAAAASPRAADRAWPLWAAAPNAAAGTAPGGGAGGSTGSSTGSGASLDDEDNVDVAAAAALGGGPLPAADGADEGARRRRRGALFESHRMATYRRRLLAICQGAVQGRLLLRSLPALPSLPRPGDVAASELLAPAAFALRAVATVKEAPPAAAANPPPQPASGDGDGAAGPPGRRGGFWGRLLARATGKQQRAEAPLELLIRVEGRGLSNVTRAWVEGIPAAAPGAAAAAAAEVTILEQPPAALPPPLERPPLPALGQVSAFASWLAASLGWVALLRRLQPAGSRDFLLARVRLPAAAVRDAQRAAQSTLLTQVTDGPLLQSLQLGPRLSLRLQTDFSSRTLPLDIRAAAQLGSPPPRWPWPVWARRGGAARAAQRAQRAQQHGAAWWEWQPRGSPAPGQ